MSDVDAWWLALLVLGLAIVVVAVLLGLILATLKTIDRRADGIWMEGKQTTGNTSAIWMLEQTNAHVARMSRMSERSSTAPRPSTRVLGLRRPASEQEHAIAGLASERRADRRASITMPASRCSSTAPTRCCYRCASSRPSPRAATSADTIRPAHLLRLRASARRSLRSSARETHLRGQVGNRGHRDGDRGFDRR